MKKNCTVFYGPPVQGWALIIFLFSFSLPFSKTYSQQPVSDSTFYTEVIGNALDLYKKEIGQNTQLYNGSEYVRNGQRAKGFPFFASDNFLTGNITYNGTLYHNVEIHYDLVLDQVIINAYNNMIRLVDVKIDNFYFPEHYFIRLDPGKSGSGIKPGFYERLYAGKISVVARHEKKLLSSPRAEEEPNYAENINYFVIKDNAYYNIDGKGALLQLLKDRKDDLKKFIRTNKLNFNRQFESSVIKTVTYYDQIKS